MAELGFVRNESARQLRMGTSSTLAYVMLDADQPVLHRRRPGHRARRRGGRPLAVHLQQRQQRRPRGDLPHPAHAAAGAGVLLTPVDPEPVARRGRRARLPLVIVDRARDVDAPARSPSTTCSAAGSPSSTSSTSVTAGSPSSAARARSARCATGGRRAAGLAPTPGCPPTTWWCCHRGAHRGRGPRRRRAHRRHAGRAPAPPPPSAATTCSRSACCSRCRGRPRVPEDLAIVGYDDIEFAAAAAVPLTSVRQPRQELGRTAAELVLDEARPRPHPRPGAVPPRAGRPRFDAPLGLSLGFGGIVRQIHVARVTGIHWFTGVTRGYYGLVTHE